jgi:hypothetical protein
MLLAIFYAIFSTAFTTWNIYNEIGPLTFPKVIFMLLGALASVATLINLLICFHAIAEPLEYED